MNKIDKIFRDRLENFHSTVPEGMWDNLDQRLSEKPDRKTRRLWVVSCLAIFVCLNGFLYLSYYSDGKNFTQSNTASELNNESKINASSVKSTFVESSNTGKSALKVNFSGNQLPSERLQIFTANGNPASAASSADPMSPDHFGDTQINNTELINNEKQADYISVASLPLAATSEDAYPEPLISKDDKPAASAVLQLNILPVHNQEQASTGQPEVLQQSNKEPQAKACPFGESSRNTHVDVYMSHEYAMKHLSDPTSLNSDYLEMRNDTESAVYSFSAGVRLGYNVGYRWNLYTGFNYSQINERFEYTDPESQVTKVIITKDYVYQQGKIIDSIITEEIITVPGTTKLKIHNRYRTFDVPVLGRYTLYADRNISLSAVAGVFINLAFRQKGMIIGTDSDKPVDIASGPDEQKNIFKSQLGITGYGALSLAWHVSPLLDLVVEPHFRMHTTSLTHEKYPLQQRYNTVGLTTGLRYRF